MVSSIVVYSQTILVITVLSLCVSFIIRRLFFPWKVRSIENKHVVITGGSSGIGKSLALFAARHGAHVTIIARNNRRLNTAQSEIRQACINVRQRIQTIPLDVTDYDAVSQKLLLLEETAPPIYMLINCAGMAICGKLEDMAPNDIKSLINLNYLGTVYPIKVVLPKMKSRRNGMIVVTASQAAMFGIYGMSAYCASKFAIRGFAEALDMECSPYNISVTVALPPDTDTPGFENENKSKPDVTKLICESGGLLSPDEVARKIISDALNRKFFSSLGFNGYLLSNLCAGMSRLSSVSELLLQFVLLGPIRLISACYVTYFHYIVRRNIENR